MNLPGGAKNDKGAQRPSGLWVPPSVAAQPRVLWVPPSVVTSAGEEAIGLAHLAGLQLDPWEQFVLHCALGERANGKWAAFEVGLEVARQNGKGAILEARELAGLFLFGERLLTHTAHRFDTSLEAFHRLLELIQRTPELDRRVDKVENAHGKEGIRLVGGQRIRFRTRTKGGGRGFSGDCTLLDEAMDLSDASLNALLPAMAARPNAQLWYAGSAVDEEIHEEGVVFARVRERGHRGDDPSLAWIEYSLPYDSPDEVPEKVAADPEAWAQSNPALNIRITTDYVANERRAMSARGFAVERLSVGKWPRTDELNQMIDLQTWSDLLDEDSTIVDPIALAIDVRPDRSRSAIAAAGRRADGLLGVEIIAHKPGTKWVGKRLEKLLDRHETLKVGVGVDETGPAGSLIPELEDLEIKVRSITTREHAQACGLFYDEVDQAGVRHCGDEELEAAIRGAVPRALGDAWAWSRKASNVDISPLVAGTLALWLASQAKPRKRKLKMHVLGGSK